MGQNQFDNKLVGRGEIGINDSWHKLINYYPTQPAFFKNGYQTHVRVGAKETSQQNLFVLKKRPGFDLVHLYEWDEGETEMTQQADEADREITDIAINDGQRYAFVVTKDRSKMRVYKQFGVNHDTCANVVLDPITVGHFVNITEYTYEDSEGTPHTINHFPFGKCVYDKFVLADRVKGKEKSSGDGYLNHSIIGNEFVASLKSDTPIVASSGDYIFVYEGTYAGQVADALLNNGNEVLINDSWAGLYNVGQPENTVTISAGSDILSDLTTVSGTANETSSIHKYKIFESFGMILNFATADGIFHLHHDEGKPSTMVVTFNYFTHSVTEDNVKDPLKIITSFNHHGSNINFLEKNYGNLISGIYGYNKFYFTSANATHLGGDYSHLVNFQGYMILIGPSHTAVFNTMYRDQGVLDFAFFELSDKKGYFSPDSFDTDDGNLVIRTNTNKLYALTIEPAGNIRSDSDLSVGYFFKPIWQYQYLEYEGEMRNLERRTDDVSLTVEDGEVQICSSPKYKDGQTTGTKIYQRSLHQQFRYTWIIEGMKVRGIKHGTWFGEHIYNLTGDKDNGQDYKTVAGMFFGELSFASPKKLDRVKLTIGSTSKITNLNTMLSVELYMEDRWHKFVYDSFGSTAYVQNLMKAKDHNDGALMFDLPIDMAIMGGNGVGINENIFPSLNNDLEEFFNYDLDHTTDTNVPDEVQVSKYGILMAPIGMVTSSVYAEIVTKGDDAVELLGMFISTDYIETFASKPDNTLTMKDRTLSGPSNKVLTNGAR